MSVIHSLLFMFSDNLEPLKMPIVINHTPLKKDILGPHLFQTEVKRRAGRRGKRRICRELAMNIIHNYRNMQT